MKPLDEATTPTKTLGCLQLARLRPFWQIQWPRRRRPSARLYESRTQGHLESRQRGRRRGQAATAGNCVRARAGRAERPGPDARHPGGESRCTFPALRSLQWHPNEAEADDLLQEIFMEIWNQAKNFSAQKGKPLGWMVTLARRRAIDGLRKKQAYARAGERLQAETELQPETWVQNATEREIDFADTRVLVREVINSLPPAQKQAIELAFFRGMSQREIAANTNTPLGTVKTRLELGLKKIYDGLKELRHEL